MKNLNQGFGDLPRERLLERGKSSLSCTELLMIMIGNGGPTCDVIEIVKNLKDFTQNNIHPPAIDNITICSFIGFFI